MPDPNIAAQWKSFDPQRRERLLVKMTPDQKRHLRQAIEAGTGQGVQVVAPISKIAAPEQPSWWQRLENKVQESTEPTTLYKGMMPNLASPTTDPVTAEAVTNVAKRVGRVLFGVPDFGVRSFRAIRDALSSDPETSAKGEDELLSLHPGAQIADRLTEVKQDWKRDPKLAGENITGDVIGMWLASKAMELPAKGAKGLSGVRAAVEQKYGPRSVPLAGVDVPVAVGEAEPMSAAGRLQTKLKRGGVGSKRFAELQAAQEQAVKDVLRQTAAQVAGLDSVSAEPGAAMKEAAEATFRAARPLYRQLDQSIRTVPKDFTNASLVVRDALSKARALGVELPEGAEVVLDGKKISRAANPTLWDRLVEQGIVSEHGETLPLSSFQKIRSQLLKLQRSTPDAAVRHRISGELRAMNDSLEAALKDSPATLQQLRAADRLWSRGYALRSIASAIRGVTRGTPTEVQSPELAPVPTRLLGARLVERLNHLDESGVLSKGFTPEESRNVRQAIDILDRIQRVPVGRGAGESLSISRGLRRAVTGAKGPFIGAAVGGAVAGLRGAEIGAGLGLVLQTVGERGLISIMTKVDGVKALKAFEKAESLAERRSALKALSMAAAAAGAARQPSTLRQLRGEAAARRPAESAAP